MSEWYLNTARVSESFSISNDENWIRFSVSVRNGSVTHTLCPYLKAHDARELAQALLASAESMERMKGRKL